MVERAKTRKTRCKSLRRKTPTRPATEYLEPLRKSAGLLREIARLIARGNELRAEYDMLQKDFLRADADLERAIRARRSAALASAPEGSL
jgi:hypothetical protein